MLVSTARPWNSEVNFQFISWLVNMDSELLLAKGMRHRRTEVLSDVYRNKAFLRLLEITPNHCLFRDLSDGEHAGTSNTVPAQSIKHRGYP